VKPCKCPPPPRKQQDLDPFNEPDPEYSLLRMAQQKKSIQLQYDSNGIPLPPSNALSLPPIPSFEEM